MSNFQKNSKDYREPDITYQLAGSAEQRQPRSKAEKRQNSLTSLRPAPSAADFRSCQGLFRGTFCNFVARNDKIIVK